MLPNDGNISAVIVDLMDTNLIRAVDGVVVVAVWVVPGANRTEVVGVHGDSVKIRVAAPASGGQANDALLRFLAKRLGCAVSVGAGGSSRRKRIHIESSDLAGIARALGIALG